MDAKIVMMLAQDGLTSGAIYVLLALTMVLVFSVTRVIFIPQGEFVAFGALTLAALQAGKVPGTLWLTLGGAIVVIVIEGIPAIRRGHYLYALKLVALYGAVPVIVGLFTWWAAPRQLGLPLQVALSLALVVPLGPILYRIAYQPLAEASVLVLLFVSVAVHWALVGLGLWFFGAEGSRTPAFSEQSLELGGVSVSGQSLWVLAASTMLIVGLYLFFDRTLFGKALRATAMNRKGAHLVGISSTLAGRVSFFFAALIGTFSGVLIGPITTIYYDSGFLMGLKGFVAAIIGGMMSYPLAAAGGVLVGLLESYSSYWASAFKEVIVFTLIIPVLLWRSLTSNHIEEDE